MGMLHEKRVQYEPPRDDDGDGTNRAWTGEKRRRKHLPQSSSSSSDAPAATAQDHQDPISPATDMEGVIQGGQPHEPLPRLPQVEEELWGPDVIISPEDAASYTRCLPPDVPPICTRSRIPYETEDDLNVRLAHYRITYYKSVADPESARELKDPQDYSVEELQRNRYFLYLEDDDSFEGCFHPEDTFVAELDDYQRLLVFNGSPADSSDTLYIYWEEYHRYYRTYEVDDDYVKFYGELSSKVKWIKHHLELDSRSEKWIEMGTRAARQALRIASRFTNLSASLFSMAFREYISELREDKALEYWSLFYFEIWKLDALKKGSLRAAVQEAFEMEKFGLEFEGMGAERKADAIKTYEYKFRSLKLEGVITESTEEDEAFDLLRKIVFKKFKPKNMAMYAQKKLEIARLMKMNPSQAQGSETREDD